MSVLLCDEGYHISGCSIGGKRVKEWKGRVGNQRRENLLEHL